MLYFCGGSDPAEGLTTAQWLAEFMVVLKPICYIYLKSLSHTPSYSISTKKTSTIAWPVSCIITYFGEASHSVNTTALKCKCVNEVTPNSLPSFLPVLYVISLPRSCHSYTSKNSHSSCQFYTLDASYRSLPVLYIRHPPFFLPVLSITHLPSFLPILYVRHLPLFLPVFYLAHHPSLFPGLYIVYSPSFLPV